MDNHNPLSTPLPWTLVARDYTTLTMPFFAQYCRHALQLSGYTGQGKVLDHACGPGTLSLLIHNTADEIQAIDFSQGMLDCFNREIAHQGIHAITTQLMDGQHLRFGDNQFDWIYSLFGLMFFADRNQGFREIYRTLKPGGQAVVSSWAPVADSPLMQMIFGAIGAAFSKQQQADSSKIINLEDPENFQREMQQAGFDHVAVTHFDGSWAVNTEEEFLDWMVKGSAPIVILKHQLAEAEWQQKRALMLAWLHTQLPQLPVTLQARAYFGTGRKQ